MWLQCRDEVTRLSSWASWGLWRSLPHQCSDLPSRRVRQPPGRRGAAKLNLGHCFLPILFTKNIDVCLVCRQPTFPFFLFYISHSSCAASLPKRPCSIVEKVPAGGRAGGRAGVLRGHPGSVPSSPCAIGLVLGSLSLGPQFSSYL